MKIRVKISSSQERTGNVTGIHFRLYKIPTNVNKRNKFLLVSKCDKFFNLTPRIRAKINRQAKTMLSTEICKAKRHELSINYPRDETGLIRRKQRNPFKYLALQLSPNNGRINAHDCEKPSYAENATCSLHATQEFITRTVSRIDRTPLTSIAGERANNEPALRTGEKER